MDFWRTTRSNSYCITKIVYDEELQEFWFCLDPSRSLSRVFSLCAQLPKAKEFKEAIKALSRSTALIYSCSCRDGVRLGAQQTKKYGKSSSMPFTIFDSEELVVGPVKRNGNFKGDSGYPCNESLGRTLRKI